MKLDIESVEYSLWVAEEHMKVFNEDFDFIKWQSMNGTLSEIPLGKCLYVEDGKLMQKTDKKTKVKIENYIKCLRDLLER